MCISDARTASGRTRSSSLKSRAPFSTLRATIEKIELRVEAEDPFGAAHGGAAPHAQAQPLAHRQGSLAPGSLPERTNLDPFDIEPISQQQEKLAVPGIQELRVWRQPHTPARQ